MIKGSLYPLTDKKIVITRAKEQAAEFKEKITERNGVPLLFPMIEISPVKVDYRSLHIKRVEWLLFTSANSVHYFFQWMNRLTQESAIAADFNRMLERVSIAVIGFKTREVLLQYGFKEAFMPQKSRQEGFIDEWMPLLQKGTIILYPRGNLANPALAREIRKSELELVEWVMYTTTRPKETYEDLAASLKNGNVDVITFTSSSTVVHFSRWLEEKSISITELLAQKIMFASIGPKTTGTAKELGIPIHVESHIQSVGALTEAIEEYIKLRRGETVMPFERYRRLRSHSGIRKMVREHDLSVSDLIYPIFVVEGEQIKHEIPSMPGVYHYSLDLLEREIREVSSLGIPSVILFGVPHDKDPHGHQAYAEEGIIQKAIRLVKEKAPELVVMADTCLCQYTDHGHCGVVENGKVLNDPSLDLLVRTAVSQAQAGADVIAPSNMMDGFVYAIREGLDQAGFEDVPILSYAVKYASAFYGPFRDAAHSTPQFGDRRTYQMDPANRREALREAQADIEQGADMLMVKPAMAYMDIIREMKEQFPYPVAAYNVSGEYSMIKAAAQNGWIDEKSVVLELLTGFKRAGADMILTYHAKDVAKWLGDDQ